MYLRFFQQQFRQFINNKKISTYGYTALIDELTTRILLDGELSFTSNENDLWSIEFKNDKLCFKCITANYPLINFKNYLLTHLNEKKVLLIIFRTRTGDIIYEGEVYELWGYKMILKNNEIKLYYIPHDELYDSSKECSYDIQHTIFCCPNGKILGWDND